MAYDLAKLQQKFFNDPDWREMEELIHSYIDPLLVMKNIDKSQPAEHVKAELIGREMAYDALDQFLRDTRVVKGRQLSAEKSNPFQ